MRYLLTALFLLSLSYNALAGINVWSQITVTDGYQMDSLLLDTTTTGRIYAGTGTGMFRSEDYGTTWIYSDWGNLGDDAVSIAVNPKSPNEVFTYQGGGFGILISTTYGYGNWTSITNDFYNYDAPALPNLLFDPENVGRMYAPSEPFGAPIYISDDTGYTWTPSYSGITTDEASSYLIMHPTQHNILYIAASASPGIYVSYNAATTWQTLPLNMAVQSLAIDPTDTNKIYAGGYSGFASSFDGGSTWDICTDTTVSNYQVIAIVVNPLDSQILYMGTAYNGVFKSKDRGNTWFSIQTGLQEQGIASLVYDTITRTLFAGTVTIDSETHPRGIWTYQDTDLTTPIENWYKY